MLNLLMPIQVIHSCQQEQEVAVESRSASGLWPQARPSVADGEACLRRPLETPEECFAKHVGFPAKENSERTVGHGFKFHLSLGQPCTEQTGEHTR